MIKIKKILLTTWGGASGYLLTVNWMSYVHRSGPTAVSVQWLLRTRIWNPGQGFRDNAGRTRQVGQYWKNQKVELDRKDKTIKQLKDSCDSLEKTKEKTRLRRQLVRNFHVAEL